MKRLTLVPLLGALALSACGSSGSPAGGSSRPDLPTGVEVRFPAAPVGALLSLQDDAGVSVYQLAVAQGKTSTDVDPTKWASQSANAQEVNALLPADYKGSVVSAVGAKVLLLHWVMWQDANQNGKQDAGEALDLMTHDRVAYASGAVKVELTTGNIHQVWNFKAGWSRAAHYVYLPTGSDTYERRLESNALQRYELHVPTPVTSQ